MPDDSTSGRAWQGRRPRLAVVVLWCAIGVACGALALTALPVAFGDADASPSTEDRLGSVFDQTIGDRLREVGAGGITGQTGIASVRPYTNPTDEVQFRVDAEEPAYWRTGAYDVYTGTQWHRSGEYQPYEMDEPPGDNRRSTRTYTVEMETATSRIPAAWRPINVDAGGRRVTYDTQGGLTTETVIGAGERITVESKRPIEEPAQLRDAGTAYPESIEQRYTSLPNSVSDRVRERAATVTDDAATPYDAAVRIEAYLRENKGYTLDVPPASEDVATELLFELDAAHCAYFATTMTTMLRAEGIPARYAVGYTTGDRVDGEYVVRDANAHAWVEVYFPEAGWVPFDPTPPDDRTSAVADSVDTVSDEDLGEIGTPDQPGSDDDPAGPDDDPDPFDPDPVEPGEPEPEGLRIATGSQPIPGQSLAVSVVEDGRPASDVTVLFDGEAIGRTSVRGTVAGQVPYTDRLEISARKPNVFGESPEIAARSYDLPTTIDLSVEGQPIAGTEATITATLAGSPVSGARIWRAGSPVTTTDPNGKATVQLPDAADTTIELGARRGAAVGTVNVTTVDVSVSVDGDPLVLPSQSVTVTATAGGDPLANEPLFVGGQQVGTENGTPVLTDANGTATVTVPPTLATTVAVGETGSTRITPLVNLGGLVVGGVLAGGAVLIGWRRFGALDSSRRSLSGSVLDRALALTDGLATGDGLGRTGDAVRSLLDRFRDRLHARVSGRSVPRTAGSRRTDPTGAVERAWLRLVAIVPGVTRTQTPRAIADQAIDLGAPRRAVEHILAAFRTTRYGGQRLPGGEEGQGLDEAIDALDSTDDGVNQR